MVLNNYNDIRDGNDIMLRFYFLCYALLLVPDLVYRIYFSEAIPKTSSLDCSDDLADWKTELPRRITWVIGWSKWDTTFRFYLWE